VIRESKAEGTTSYDIPGAIAVTTGLVSLVYGFTKASTDGWSSPTTLAFLLAAVALLTAFVLIELRVSHPLLPMRVVLERNRGASYLAALLATAALFGMFLFLSYYFQSTLHYSALKSGIAFLPFSAGIMFAAGAASQVLPRLGPRVMLTGGLISAALGLLWLTQINVHGAYGTHVLPTEILISLGMGFVFVPLNSTALYGVGNQDAGVASALINTAQQVGGSLGTALLNTIAATATASYIVTHGKAHTAAGLVHGYTVAFLFGTILLLAAAVITALMVTAPKDELVAGDAGMVVA
jgi:predicted MFS family arabinose efflux permease